MAEWPTREYANAGDPLEIASRNSLTLIKALYILADGDRAKVIEAVKRAEDVRLKDVRGVPLPQTDQPQGAPK